MLSLGPLFRFVSTLFLGVVLFSYDRPALAQEPGDPSSSCANTFALVFSSLERKQPPHENASTFFDGVMKTIKNKKIQEPCTASDYLFFTQKLSLWMDVVKSAFAPSHPSSLQTKRQWIGITAALLKMWPKLPPQEEEILPESRLSPAQMQSDLQIWLEQFQKDQIVVLQKKIPDLLSLTTEWQPIVEALAQAPRPVYATKLAPVAQMEVAYRHGVPLSSLILCYVQRAHALLLSETSNTSNAGNAQALLSLTLDALSKPPEKNPSSCHASFSLVQVVPNPDTVSMLVAAYMALVQHNNPPAAIHFLEKTGWLPQTRTEISPVAHTTVSN